MAGPDASAELPALRNQVEQLVLWPETEVVPFHYDHPVTGQKWTV